MGEHTHPLYAVTSEHVQPCGFLLYPTPQVTALDSSGSWGRESMLGHGSSSSYVLFYSEEIVAHEEK